MSKISEIVKVRDGYTNFVNLRNALQEEAENSGRMAMYRPTKAHRTALERISRGLFTPNDRKFYLLSGSYGTGKSHLCLMLANLLSHSSNAPCLKGFYDNYDRLDHARANELKHIRQDGQYLVVVCDYGAGQKFEDAVLSAIMEVCVERGIATDRITEFDEAERRLAEWEASSKEKKGVRDFYADFVKALSQVSPGTPIAGLRAGLKKFDRPMMDKFLAAYAEAQGDPFQAKAGNLVSIVKQLVRSKEFTEKFKGLAIFFDEFGTAILQHSKFDAAVMQAFMEDICQHEANVLFVGCIHKGFKDYAERTSHATAAVMEARLTQVPLANEGIEEIIGAIVETEKTSAVWKNEVHPKVGVFDQLTPQCVSLKLFPWITDTARIREKVLEDIYGVHPMALHCLLKLSSEIGSDARSTFTFFSGNGADIPPGSYPQFIQQTEIVGSSGALRLYQAHQLFEFFEKELSPGSRELMESQRAFVNGYVASLQALKKSVSVELFDEQQDERVDLLRMVLIYSLCGVTTSLENLQFGRYCLTNSEKAQVKKLLGDLEKAGAIYLRKPSNTYELCANEGLDPFTLIENFSNLAETDEKSTTDELLKQAEFKEEFLVAQQFNVAFGDDKRLNRKFVRGRDLGTDLWTALEKDFTEAAAKFQTAYEGHAVYALCEDEAEIKLAREAIKTIPVGTILVAIPAEPTPFRDSLKKVLACRHYLTPEEAAKQPAQTVARIRDMLDNGLNDGYLPSIKKVVDALQSGAQATWYETKGKVLFDKPPQAHKPADMLCERLFKERCQIKHVDLNLSHDEKWQKINSSLKQAIEGLLNLASPVQIENASPDNHGEKRYLEKVLFRGCGALRALPSTSNYTKIFAAESDPKKIDAKFPVLKKLCERLTALKADQALGIAAFVKEMRAAPVGAGGTMLVLALGHVVRGFGERLCVFRDSTHSDSADLASYDAIVKAISDSSTKLELALREISAPQQKFIDAVAKGVNATPLASGEQRTVTATCDALRAWWKKLPAVAKVTDLYPAPLRKRVESLCQTLNDGSIERFDLMLNRLPAVYAGEPVDKMTAKQAEDWGTQFAREAIRFLAGQADAQREVADAILKLHGKTGDLIVCEKVVTEWFTNLTPDQRDPSRCTDEDAQQLLIALNASKSFESKLTQSLPVAWGFGPIADWTSLQTVAFKAKWEQSKKAIEEIKPIVSDPTVTPEELMTKVKDNVWEVEDGAKLRIQIPPGAKSVIYTMGKETVEEALDKITMNDSGSITLDLKGKSTGELHVRAIDESGNASRTLTYHLTHKQKQHEISIEAEDLFGERGSFKFPTTQAQFIAVVRSLTKKAREREVITPAAAEQLNAVLDAIKKG